MLVLTFHERGKYLLFGAVLTSIALGGCASNAETSREDWRSQGWEPLFEGEDLTSWVVPEGDGGHWRVVGGIIDYDAMSEAEGEKNLWTKQSFDDFVLRVDWRINGAAGIFDTPIIQPDGSYKRTESGEVVTVRRPSADSGILLRGTVETQANIWNWPVGSGEVYGYRTDEDMPPEVRAAVTPKMRADRALGMWNTFVITMRGERLTVELNGTTVIENAWLPGVPEEGPIGLQHHGGVGNGAMHPLSSLVQFRNIYIKEL